MNAIRLLIFLTLFNVLDTRYSVYYSNDPSVFDCLYAHLTDFDEYIDPSHIATYHLIPYCRRPDENEEEDHVSNILLNNIDKMITFNDLHKQGVTSEQLLEWSAPINIAERYEMKDVDSMEVFYNCSLPWFGPVCQYRFDYELPLSFDDIVRRNFVTRPRIGRIPLDFTVGTCYHFLTNCYRGSSSVCLDWREICDGKLDCINGEDEQYCQTLEMSECPDDTYRCHYGGQCIPMAFVRDGAIGADCLDGTDEIELNEAEFHHFGYTCFTFPTFRCEERTSRYLLTFSCGDGQYSFLSIARYTGLPCSNGRDIQISLSRPNLFPYAPDLPWNEIFNSTLNSKVSILNRTLINASSTHTLVTCESINKNCLSKLFFKVELVYAYSTFHFIYLPDRLIPDFIHSVEPDFICFNPKKCPAMVNYAVDIGLNNGLTCCRSSELTNGSLATGHDLQETLEKLFVRCSTTGVDQTCSHPSLFHCPRSMKCVSKHRLVDSVSDCHFGEDETFPTCQLNDSRRFTCESEEHKCLSSLALYNGKYDCKGKEDEMTENHRNILKGDVPFGLLCDGKRHPLLSESNETDETNCEYWPCDNTYVRCNTFRNCPNGSDELNCPKIQYTMNQAECSKPVSTNMYCPPVMRLMEKNFDVKIFYTEHAISSNSTINNDTIECFFSDISCRSLTEICQYVSAPSAITNLCRIKPRQYCFFQDHYWMPTIKTHICPYLPKALQTVERKVSVFTSSQLGYFPAVSAVVSPTQNGSNVEKQTGVFTPILSIQNWYCNRGIVILFNNNITKKCLCPPSYFGSRCQWQNQRISLTLQLGHRVDTFTIAVFQVIIMVIDEQRQIAPYHEQITYVPKRDCGTKYNLYLLYPNQPKNSSANYSIHIDIFDKITLTYLASWHLSIPVQFLPVNRIATQLFIPSMSIISKSCPLFCGKHGRCVRYINKNFSYFCQCDQGYSGSECHIKHNCSCLSGSFCLTSSICICPMNTFGSKCYLKHSMCRASSNPCQNNGLCVPVDDRMALNKFTCLCTESFYGTKCENIKNRIDIEFNDEKISLMPFILVHFIAALDDDDHQRMTVLKKIMIEQNIITVFATRSFHILLIELTNQTLYLGALRERFIESEYIQTKVLSNYRCSSISELMNITFENYPFLRRVKYYPLLCRQNKQLMCFYDNRLMCICDLDRFSNCFTLNRTIPYDCQGENICENGGLCFQDNTKCPTVSVCVCSDCYYGTKCQFSTRGFVLSLDYILGYHIKPNVSFNRQPFIIKMSVIIITLMLVLGLINGLLSIVTFRRKEIRNFSCGLCLLISSWNSLCLITVLIIKFCQLILSQMAILTNRPFLTLNCILLDMILKVLITTNDWLYGCVALERVFTVFKGVSFNQIKSKQMAKWMILIIYLLTILTHVHDPIHRRLINDFDADEQRTWCLAQYSSANERLNIFITIFHFLIPFSINLISTIFIIILMARSRSTVQPCLSYKAHLQQQFHQHKHNLFATCALLLLALPRLIISFISGCMKSPRDPWLFLFGYFISFIPSMMTFIVFVLPAKKYKDGFNATMRQAVRQFRSRFYLQTL